MKLGIIKTRLILNLVEKYLNAISKTIDLLDAGKIRVAEKKIMNGLLINGLKKQFY